MQICHRPVISLQLSPRGAIVHARGHSLSDEAPEPQEPMPFLTMSLTPFPGHPLLHTSVDFVSAHRRTRRTLPWNDGAGASKEKGSSHPDQSVGLRLPADLHVNQPLTVNACTPSWHHIEFSVCTPVHPFSVASHFIAIHQHKPSEHHVAAFSTAQCSTSPTRAMKVSAAVRNLK